MQLLSLTQFTEQRATGRLSDGSDRVVTNVAHWQAVVLDDQNVQHVYDFPEGGVQPTHQQIIDRIPKPAALVPTAKADLETYMASAFATWQRWSLTRAEATRRAAPAAVITALQAREDAAWTAYLGVIQSWRQAV